MINRFLSDDRLFNNSKRSEHRENLQVLTPFMILIFDFEKRDLLTLFFILIFNIYIYYI